MAIKQKLMDLLDAELENLNLFLPFLFALGIAFYFSLSNEPNIYIAPIVLSVLSVGLIVFKKYFYLVLPFIFFVGRLSLSKLTYVMLSKVKRIPVFLSSILSTVPESSML